VNVSGVIVGLIVPERFADPREVGVLQPPERAPHDWVRHRAQHCGADAAPSRQLHDVTRSESALGC
jgi:hypothetical protein